MARKLYEINANFRQAYLNVSTWKLSCLINIYDGFYHLTDWIIKLYLFFSNNYDLFYLNIK